MSPMKRPELAQRIQAILDEHFPAPPIPLDHADPFSLLIAVLLSAPCRSAMLTRCW